MFAESRNRNQTETRELINGFGLVFIKPVSDGHRYLLGPNYGVETESDSDYLFNFRLS